MARKKAINKEAKKLRQFLKDYDDDKDDQVYFKGGAHLKKKLQVREKEIETDNRDRQRERDELDQLKKRLRASWSMSKWKLNELV